MSAGNGGGGVAAPAAPVNPMPVLTAEVREALTASIKEHGVICPVVKDQTGVVLDGNHRITLAAELGIPCPEIVYTCTPDQREILRIELNGARRQITASQWKPLVDHLRSLRTSSGHRFSDRAIAQAVGVSKSTVHDYRPVSAGVRSRTPASKTVGKDGKAQNKGQGETATDRVLRLIRASTTGLTVEDLRNDSVLSGFGQSTISTIPRNLRARGLIEEVGKRDRSAVWKAVANPVTPVSTPTPNKTVARKAEQIIENLKDERVRYAVKEGVADSKELREAGSAVRAAERELEAIRADKAKRAADDERERLRLIEAGRKHIDTSIRTWDKLIAEVHAAGELIAGYSAHLADLPAISPSYERILDRELDDLRLYLDHLDKKLHPGGHNPVQQGAVIDV